MTVQDEAATSVEEQALLQVLQEERKLPSPKLNAGAVEARVLRKIAAETPPKRRGARWSAKVAVALLVAAGVAVKLSFKEAPRSPALEALANVASEKSVSGETLALRQPLRAQEEPLYVEHPGHVRWSLAPGSEAELVRRDSVVVVRLLHGSLEADVAPRPVPETFVVEAGPVRAAVHGTRFVVGYDASGVVVDVKEGIVMVTREGSAQSTPLRAPARESFAPSLEAAPERREARRSESAPAPAPRAPARPEAKTVASVAASLPEEPSIAAVEAGVSEVVAAVQRCFASGAKPEAGVEITARTTILLQVQPNGEASLVGFTPPLSPSVTSCSRAALGSVRFAASQRGIALRRVLDLRR